MKSEHENCGAQTMTERQFEGGSDDLFEYPCGLRIAIGPAGSVERILEVWPGTRESFLLDQHDEILASRANE